MQIYKTAIHSIFALTVFVAASVLMTIPVKADNLDLQCGDQQPRIDYSCQRARIISPNSGYANCCETLYCPGSTPSPGCHGGAQEFIDVNFFGVSIRFNNSRQLAALIYLGFSAFLGIVAITVAIYAIRGAYLRAKAEKDDDVKKAFAMMRNAIIGFVIVGMSLLVVQIVAGLLGLGSIDQIVREDLGEIFNQI